MAVKNPKKILITGASSGIGAELARQYAKNGVTLYITGRNAERLEKVKSSCEELGAEVEILAADVCDDALAIWISCIENLDLVIANAGISAGTGDGGESVSQVKNIFNTNVYGVINTIHPAIENMKKAGRGHIAIISSLAGYRGIPSCPAYSGSKAAVKVYGEALRVDLKKYGVDLTVITPGYIKTPMTDVNDFYMPFIMTAEKASGIIISRLRRNPARIAFPFGLYFVVWLISLLPPGFVDPILGLLPQKPSEKSK